MLNDKIKVRCTCGKTTTIRVRKLFEMEKRINTLEDENRTLRVKLADLGVMHKDQGDSFEDILKAIGGLFQ